MILGGVLRQLGGEVFGRLQRPQDFITALDRLFGNLIAEGTPPEALRSALESRADRDAFERERDGELQLIYAEYLKRLATRSRRDGRDALLDCATAVAADPAGLADRLGGLRELRLFGLQDLRGGWRPLLRALSDSGAFDRIAVYTAEPLEVGLDAAPHVTLLGEPETVAARLFTPEPRRLDASGLDLALIGAPDVERELEDVARRVRSLALGGTPLHRIAVITRQARPYVDLALTALHRFGVPATARRRIGWSEIPVIRAVRALLAAAAEGWTRHSLTELAEQPYFARWQGHELDVRLVSYAGYRRRLRGLKQWRSALDGIAQEAAAYEERLAQGEEQSDERRAPLPQAARARDAAEGFARFAEKATDLDPPRKLSAWLTWLRDFLHNDPWGMERRIWRVPEERYDIARLDLAGWRGLTKLVDEWRGALEEWGGREEQLTAEAFYRQFLDLLDGDAALWTETQRGVQVLEALAAAYRSFDHVFLVGLEAGRFPVPAPSSPILDDRERDELAAAGLPLEARAVWDARERELFRILVASARRSLTLSSSLLDTAGREVVPSAFVEALSDVVPLEEQPILCSTVITDGIRLGAPAGLERAATLARIEWGRQRQDLSPYAGLIESADLREHVARELGESRLWSPTQLESYAKCPWAYFSGRLLKLDRLEDPDEEMDNATRGVLLHEALRKFFMKALEKTPSPVLIREADNSWVVELAEQVLDETLAEARGKRWLGSELLLEPKRLELRRILLGYLRWEMDENEKLFGGRGKAGKRVRTGVKCHEEELGEIAFERDGVRIRFRGSVDRVEVGVDDRIDSPRAYVAAVDYKTTKYSCPGKGESKAWADGVVLQVPLYAWALARKHDGTHAVRVEYRALKKPEAVHSLELYTVSKGRSPVPDEKATDKLEQALDAVVGHVRAARSGSFPVRPPKSCKCPSFCHSLEICRVPGGPDTGGW